MSDPIPLPDPDGTRLTVERDGDYVVVCGVRLPTLAATQFAARINGHVHDIHEEHKEKTRAAAQEAERQAWIKGAVATCEAPRRARLLPDGRVQVSLGWVRAHEVPVVLRNLIAGSTEPRRLWWMAHRGNMLHLDGCGCCAFWTNIADARLLPAAEIPPKICKRSAKKLGTPSAGGTLP